MKIITMYNENEKWSIIIKAENTLIVAQIRPWDGGALLAMAEWTTTRAGEIITYIPKKQII